MLTAARRRIGTARSALAALALAAVSATLVGCGGGFFRQYEYEEDVYVSLDGSATVYVNGSLAALAALRGADVDLSPIAPVDRERVRRFFESPVTRVTRVSASRRSGRRFVHVRIDVDDIRRLSEAAPFSWSAYHFERDGNLYVYRQTIGSPVGKAVGDVGWTGGERVAFRLHIPSKIAYYSLPGTLKRGNILVWEQPLADRLRGVPLTLDARMETQSILYRTLWLFALTFVAVAITFAIVIWWVLRRGGSPAEV